MTDYWYMGVVQIPHSLGFSGSYRMVAHMWLEYYLSNLVILTLTTRWHHKCYLIKYAKILKPWIESILVVLCSDVNSGAIYQSILEIWHLKHWWKLVKNNQYSWWIFRGGRSPLFQALHRVPVDLDEPKPPWMFIPGMDLNDSIWMVAGSLRPCATLYVIFFDSWGHSLLKDLLCSLNLTQ